MYARKKKLTAAYFFALSYIIMTRDEYLILTFIIVIAIILMSPDLTSAMLIVSILANVYVLTTLNYKHRAGAKKENFDGDTAQPAAPVAQPPSPPAIPPAGLRLPSLYGPAWDKYSAYKDDGPTGWAGCNIPGGSCGTVYNPNVDIPEGTVMSIDQANVELARRRARDKLALEGQVLKDANYYKYHFGDELDISEKKRWWGNSEW